MNNKKIIVMYFTSLLENKIYNVKRGLKNGWIGKNKYRYK